MSKLIQTSCIDLYIYTHMHMNLFHHAFVHVCARKHVCSRAPEFTSLRGPWSEDPVTLELETLWTFELYSSGVLGGGIRVGQLPTRCGIYRRGLRIQTLTEKARMGD